MQKHDGLFIKTLRAHPAPHLLKTIRGRIGITFCKPQDNNLQYEGAERKTVPLIWRNIWTLDQHKTKELTMKKQKACSFKAKYCSINIYSFVKVKEMKR